MPTRSGSEFCAITLVPMAHQWRNRSALSLGKTLRKKAMAQSARHCASCNDATMAQHCFLSQGFSRAMAQVWFCEEGS
jgi:hypothetical protein